MTKTSLFRLEDSQAKICVAVLRHDQLVSVSFPFLDVFGQLVDGFDEAFGHGELARVVDELGVAVHEQEVAHRR